MISNKTFRFKLIFCKCYTKYLNKKLIYIYIIINVMNNIFKDRDKILLYIYIHKIKHLLYNVYLCIMIYIHLKYLNNWESVISHNKV